MTILRSAFVSSLKAVFGPADKPNPPVRGASMRLPAKPEAEALASRLADQPTRWRYHHGVLRTRQETRLGGSLRRRAGIHGVDLGHRSLVVAADRINRAALPVLRDLVRDAKVHSIIDLTVPDGGRRCSQDIDGLREWGGELVTIPPGRAQLLSAAELIDVATLIRSQQARHSEGQVMILGGSDRNRPALLAATMALMERAAAGRLHTVDDVSEVVVQELKGLAERLDGPMTLGLAHAHLLMRVGETLLEGSWGQGWRDKEAPARPVVPVSGRTFMPDERSTTWSRRLTLRGRCGQYTVNAG